MRSNTLDNAADFIPLDSKRELNFCVYIKKSLMSVPKFAIVIIENNAEICLVRV
jgi:hypothetical protein